MRARHLEAALKEQRRELAAKQRGAGALQAELARAQAALEHATDRCPLQPCPFGVWLTQERKAR